MQNTIIQSTICYLTKRLPPFQDTKDKIQNTIFQNTICHLTKRLPPFACREEMEERFPWKNIIETKKIIAQNRFVQLQLIAHCTNPDCLCLYHSFDVYLDKLFQISIVHDIYVRKNYNIIQD